MITKRFSLIAILLLVASALFAQKILNGNFENVSGTSTSQYNLSNEQWTSYVDDCYGFGTGTELDIQNVDSPWGKPAVGKWWVSLASPSGRPDGFTMKLSSPLIKGRSYELSWWQMAGQSGANGLDKLLLGVSDDKMEFGTQFYETDPKQNGKYEKTSIKFVAPQTGIYISVQNGGANNGWNFVDDFELKMSDADILISYSPVGSNYIVSFDKGIDEVIITDSDGKQLSDEKYSGEKMIEIDAGKFPESDLYIEVRYGTRSASTSLEVTQIGRK